MSSLNLTLGSSGVLIVMVRSFARACSICSNVTKRNLLVSFRNQHKVQQDTKRQLWLTLQAL
jgi:hypothetical protein